MTSQTPSQPTGETTGQLTSGPVLLDVSDGVATITLNRPEAMNSLDIATKEILVEVVRQVSEDPSVRCVVLTGTGRAFCTGQDLKEHINLLETGGSDQLFTTVEKHYNPIVSAIMAMEKPVIAAVNGVAEELFFRGAAYAAVPKHPVTVTTIAYTIATMATGNLMLSFAAVLLGIVVGLERRASGGILAPIITHLTWSLSMLVLLPLIFL